MNTHCEVNRQMLSWLQNLNVRFYLNRINKKGWGVIYAYFRCNGKNYRIPTNIKVMAQYWNSIEQRVILNYSTQARLEYLIHLDADKHLNNIQVQIFEKKYYYICNSDNTSSIEEVTNSIISTITQYREMSTKIKSDVRLILTLNSIVDRAKNGTSVRTYKSFVNVFKEFISKESIPDSLKSLNDDTMRKYRNWLADNRDAKRGAKRCNDCLWAIFTLAKDLEKYDGYEFNLHPERIKKIEDPRTQDERNNNNIALTHEEIEILLSIELDDEEEIVRDLFIIQCWSGIRYEDLAKILNSSNFIKDGDLITSVFKPKKTIKHNIEVKIPLNNHYLYPRCIELINKYIDACPYKNNASDLIAYNSILKTVAKKAGLNRTMTLTKDLGGGKKQSYQTPIYNVIASHDGRHTFITNCLRYFHFSKSFIRGISGHASDEQIETTYDNTMVDDRVRSQNKLLSEQSRILENYQHQQPTAPTPTAQLKSLPNSIDEAKRVLNFLGCNPDAYMEIDNLDDLLRLIAVKESFIIKGFNPKKLDAVKEIFNEDADIITRKEHLHNLITFWKLENK